MDAHDMRTSPPTASEAPRPYDELRALVVGPERQEIRSLRSAVDANRVTPDTVGGVLAPAIREHADSADLAEAMVDPVEAALRASVRRDPQQLADAIFPVILPAIRRAIAAMVDARVQSLNRALEHSLSVRGLRWRLEAFRTGTPFAEVVLRHSLTYTVEQVFLIHRQSGLLLQHVTAPSTSPESPDLVAGLLSAIRDFAHDSFDMLAGDSVNTLQVGDLTLWIEQGSAAVLAAAVRGTAPAGFRDGLTDAVGALHQQFTTALTEFSGDTRPFDATRPLLEACLRESAPAPAAALRLPILAGVFGTLVVGWLAWSGYHVWQLNRLVQGLDAAPGIAVTGAERRAGHFRVRGLRDPLSTNPVDIAGAVGIDATALDLDFEPYHAPVSTFALARAQRALSPPAGVTLSIDGSTLRVTGPATAAWLADARAKATLIPGIDAVDGTPEDGETFARVADRIEQHQVSFARSSAVLDAAGEAALRAAVRDLEMLRPLAVDAGGRIAVRVVSGAGGGSWEVRLAERRRDVVRRALIDVVTDVDVVSEATTDAALAPRAVALRVTAAPTGARR